MAKPTLADLKERADSVYSTYSANFAGKPRATRDLSMLDNLIGELSSVVEDARTLMNGDRNPAILSFLETATDNLERYRNEQSAIQDAQSRPYAAESALVANRANRVFDVYGRHFAGKDRATRDRMLLHEMVLELEELRGQLQKLVDAGAESARSDLETVEKQLGLYREEVTNIARASTVGTPDEVASRLAELANRQFALYREHFAGKSRVTRRPELLERLIANLEEYQAEMRELQDEGYTSEQNRNNIGIIAQNLELYRTELQEVRKARDENSVRDIAGALGGAANDIFNEYGEHFAGKDRRTRDLELMGRICDALRDVALQMRAIDQQIEIEMNQKNLRIVEERWATYESEYRKIAEARGLA